MKKSTSCCSLQLSYVFIQKSSNESLQKKNKGCSCDVVVSLNSKEIDLLIK